MFLQMELNRTVSVIELQRLPRQFISFAKFHAAEDTSKCYVCLVSEKWNSFSEWNSFMERWLLSTSKSNKVLQFDFHFSELEMTPISGIVTALAKMHFLTNEQ